VGTGDVLDRREAGAGRGERHAPSAGGFTLLELMFVMSVLLVMFLTVSQSLLGSIALNEVNRESALAQDGMRAMLEELEGTGEFETVFSRYNSDPTDDPPLGASPGDGFAVPGLDPLPTDPDGLVGEIVFPTLDTAGGLELREDLNLPELGMPRDLDGLNGVDGFDHDEDYRLLPVLLRIEWQGQSGTRRAETRTMLADR